MVKKQINVWVIAFVITTLILMIFVIVAIIDLNQYYQQTYCISRAIENQNVCSSANAGICQLTLNLDLTAPQISSLQMYSTENALFCATLVSCVEYPVINNQAENQIPVPSSLSHIQNISYDNNIIGAVFTSADIIWIVFRGTRTKEEWNKDLMFQQVSYPHTSFFPTTKKFLTNTTAGYDAQIRRVQQASDVFFEGFIHEGFLDIYNCIRQQILDLLPSFETQTYLVTAGHSLGAALATILSSDRDVLAIKTHIVCYTFGGPKVGNTTFTNFVNTQTQNLYFRVVNEDDIICDLPPSVSPNFKTNADDVFLYSHAGGSNVTRFQDNRGALLYNHQMQTYLDFLRT